MTTIIQSDSETRVVMPGFTIFVHKCEEGETGYWAEVMEMPGCVSQGETLDELRANIQEAMEAISHQFQTSIPGDISSNFSMPSTETSTA